MKKLDPNAGWLEREFLVAVASWKAYWRCQFHWDESEIFYEEDDGRTIFIGTCVIKKEHCKIIKTYYGEVPKSQEIT